MITEAIVSSMVNRINNEMADIEDIEALLSFSSVKLTAPLTKVFFAFITEENTVDHFQDENLEFCRKTKIKISLNCYAPFSFSGEQIIAKVEEVLDRLFDYYGSTMTGYTLQRIKVDRDMKALIVPCTIFVAFESCPAYESKGSILLPSADFLCKSHVVDTNLHLSDAQREKLSAPFVMGSYTGNGQNQAEIALPFTPKIVIVYASQLPLYEYNTSNGKTYCRFALAGAVAGQCLSIKTNAFKISQGTAASSDKTVFDLNGENAFYGYIAFK